VSFLVQTARALNVPAAQDSLFEVAVNEALANAVKHGSRGNSDGVIVCELEIAPSQLIVRVIDNGPGFTVPAPTLPRITPGQPQALPERGYGVPIIQSVFPVVRAIRSNGRFGLELRLPII
jgi:anti-sigma regulatory factor (Ser/Thr protein kinase)